MQVGDQMDPGVPHNEGGSPSGMNELEQLKSI